MAVQAPSLKLIANGAFAARLAASLTEWRGAESGELPPELPALAGFVLVELGQYTRALLQSESLPTELDAFRRRFPTARSLIDYLRVLHACATDRRYGEYFHFFLGVHLAIERHPSFGEPEFVRAFQGKVTGAELAIRALSEFQRPDRYDPSLSHALLLRIADQLERLGTGGQLQGGPVSARGREGAVAAGAMALSSSAPNSRLPTAAAINQPSPSALDLLEEISGAVSSKRADSDRTASAERSKEKPARAPWASNRPRAVEREPEDASSGRRSMGGLVGVPVVPQVVEDSEPTMLADVNREAKALLSPELELAKTFDGELGPLPASVPPVPELGNERADDNALPVPREVEKLGGPGSDWAHDDPTKGPAPVPAAPQHSSRGRLILLVALAGLLLVAVLLAIGME